MKLDQKEVNRARVGPRELKDPRSREYAIQTLYALKRYLDSARLDEELVRKEMERIEQYRHWEVLGYPSKTALLKAEVGTDEKGIEDKLRKREIGIEGGKPGPGRGHKTPTNGSRFRYGGNTVYILARLKRDRPDLAEKVEAGILTANAAAIIAGFRKKAMPLDQLRKAWKKASDTERETFLHEVTQ